jgi:thioredoxin reductase
VIYDCIVIGGGQAGLASGYYLKKEKFNYLILDNQEQAGGAWLHTWDNLHIFSPAESSSLPGYIMPKDIYEYPHKSHVVKYLNDYEKRYDLNINRPENVLYVVKEQDIFIIKTDKNTYKSKTIIASTGTWSNPNIPNFKGIEKFKGEIVHSANYYNPSKFKGKNVFVVGAGNSGAQIVADLNGIAYTYWITNKTPNFLPEDVDGRYLFSLATQYYRAKQKGEKIIVNNDLGDIVQIPVVKKALQDGKLSYYSMFDEIDENGAIWGNTRLDVDAIILCTGFKSSYNFLNNLGIVRDNRIETDDTKVLDIDGLWLVGYGNWTGFASATLVGVGRYAKESVNQIKLYLKK